MVGHYGTTEGFSLRLPILSLTVCGGVRTMIWLDCGGTEEKGPMSRRAVKVVERENRGGME